jgi:hypothetical protein
MTENLKNKIEMYLELNKEVKEFGDALIIDIEKIAQEYLPRIQERLGKDDQVHNPSVCNTEEGLQISYDPDYERINKLANYPKISMPEYDNFADNYCKQLNEKVKDIYQEIEQKHGVKVSGINLAYEE